MTPTSPMRDHAPRTALRLHRNHFASGPEKPLSDSLMGFSEMQVVGTIATEKPLSTALMASQRSRRYRFGLVNAVHNPLKVLAGDDETVME